MEEFSKRTWAQINLDALEYNFKSIKSKLKSGTKILCVLKADAYGHGAEFLVKKYGYLYTISQHNNSFRVIKNLGIIYKVTVNVIASPLGRGNPAY